jgi:hypothetical protein
LRRRGEPHAEAPNRRLAVFPIICRSCTDFLTRPSTYLCLIQFGGASLGGLGPIRFGNGLYRGSGSIRSIDRLNCSWCSLAGRSNGCRLILGTVVCSGDRRLFWRPSSVLATVVCSGDRRLFWRPSSVLATVVCSGDRRLFWRPSSVLATVVCSGDRRLFWRPSSVLATVVCFWSQSSTGYRSGASLGREDVRKEGQRWHLGAQGVCKRHV